MLVNEEMFQRVEKMLTDNGKLASYFSDVNDEFKGRMMITKGEVPNNLGIDLPEKAVAFIGSFDFYDACVGIAIDPTTQKVCSGLWVTPQAKNAEAPSKEWIEFFISKVIEGIREDGSFGTPVYSFIGDCHDMTVIPDKP